MGLFGKKKDKNPFLRVEGAGRLVFDADGWLKTEEGQARLKRLMNSPITKALREGKQVQTDEFGIFIKISDK
jgi:hypothetical protein